KMDSLYKWYLWCWAYRDMVKDLPCIGLPDDHDVYQGNIWGAGGKKGKTQNHGGYVNPADFVKMVDRTQTSHLPDAYDPTPIKQGINVYYTDMVYGRISFGIIEDRKFKDGPIYPGMPNTGTRRPDHFNNPNFDVTKLDIPGLNLLGDRQLKFIDDWTQNWKGADMKVLLSQTIFGNMATHHGGTDEGNRLIADLDSNGWPQTGRNKAVRALRKGFAFHLAGDQHLATIVHHGVDEHRDGIWSFCVPSVANFYPRKWYPLVEGKNRPAGAPTWQGDHVDGFKNKVTIYAAANPGKSFGIEPKDLHDKMAGYGIVTLDKMSRDIKMECWSRWAVPGKDPQYDGWPQTINQMQNYGREAQAYLPTIECNVDNAVIQVVDEKSGEVLYTVRASGKSFKAKVFALGNYTLKVSEPDTGKMKMFKKVKAVKNGQGILKVTL
ncbi:MAG: twin-arginine translocation pathway signal protein, partial [Lentisphaeraceae bacterium]|nr:twin-arginine translocation pathway signal protein [Lentisphaeraceae bacterium]